MRDAVVKAAAFDAAVRLPAPLESRCAGARSDRASGPEALEQTIGGSQKVAIAPASAHQLHAHRQTVRPGRRRHGDAGNMNRRPHAVKDGISSAGQSKWRLAGSTRRQDRRVPVKQAIDHRRALDLQSPGALDIADVEAKTRLDQRPNFDTQLIAVGTVLFG